MLRVASFDIGKKNFAFTVDVLPLELLHPPQWIPKSRRYCSDGTPTPEFETILNKIASKGSLEFFRKTDLTFNCDPTSYLDPETFHNMTDFLSEFDHVWDTCQIFLVERQMSNRNKFNTMALKLGQHCLAYFRIRYGRLKYTIEFPAYHKTHVLGAPPTTKGKTGPAKTKRKKWAESKASQILHLRNDSDSLKLFHATKKKDDIADCLLQTTALICLIQQDNYLRSSTRSSSSC